MNFSYVTHFSDQPLMLNYHLDLWKKYSRELADKIEFILIDNSLNKPVVKIDKGHLNLNLYRIEKPICWNYAVKNVGMHLAINEWVFLTELDHSLPEKAARGILELPRSPNVFFKFKRRNYAENSSKRYSTVPHAGTFFLSKEAFWGVGGIEEDLVGHYGFDDCLLFQCLKAKGFKCEIPDKIFIENHSESNSDADFVSHQEWNRDLSRNKKIFDQKMKWKEISQPLRLKWEKIE